MEETTDHVSNEGELEEDMVCSVAIRYEATWKCLNCGDARAMYTPKGKPPRSQKRAMFCMQCQTRQDHELIISPHVIAKTVAWGIRRIKSKIALPRAIERKAIERLIADPPLNRVMADALQEHYYPRYLPKR